MSIFDFFSDRKPGSTNNCRSKFNRNAVRSRRLRMEALEERALLSVTTGAIDDDAYAEIRAQYPEFNLPEEQANLNIMTVDCNLEDLNSAITQAGESTNSDLILVRTTNDANTITYSSYSNEISLNIDVSEFGSISIIGWGAKKMTLNANQNCRVMTISENTEAYLGNMTITNGYLKRNPFGAGIYSTGVLSLTGCDISNNSIDFPSSSSYGYGGGIYSTGVLSLTGCDISNNSIVLNSSSHSYGGGIYSAGVLTLTGCSISNNLNKTYNSNHASSSGGGIYSSGTMTLIGCTVSSNIVSSENIAYGGGIYSSESISTLIGCTISNNSASSYYNSSGSTARSSYGGGIYSYLGSMALTGCTISSNTASSFSSSFGGGIYASSTDSMALTGCLISNNSASSYPYFNIGSSSTHYFLDSPTYGGGICFSSTGALALNSCNIFNNSLTSSVKNGAGIYMLYGASSLSIIDTNITSTSEAPSVLSSSGNTLIEKSDLNYASVSISGGNTWSVLNSSIIGTDSVNGISITSGNLSSTLNVSNSIIRNCASYGIYTCSPINALIVNSTITNNSCYGIFVNNPYTVFNFYNSIVAKNTFKDVYNASGATINFFNSLSSYNNWTDGSDNIVYNRNYPLFVDEDNSDYRLAENSPAINAGNNAYAVDPSGQSLVTDLAGIPRILGARVDIGAFEYDSDLLAKLPLPDFSITPYGTSAVVAISDVEGASGYKIEYSVNSNFTNSTIIDAQAGENLLEDLQESQTYHIRVKSIGNDDYLDSDYSTTQFTTVTTLAGLTLSTNFPVVGTEITTTLDPVDATVEYQWFADETLIEGEEGSSFTVTEAQIGQTITCVVTGTDNYTGTVSATTAVVPALILPPLDAPTLTAEEPTITASWAGNANASSYTLQYQIDGADGWTTITDILGTTTSFVGVAGTTYNVKVQANGTGNYSDSEFSEVASITLAAPITELTLSNASPIVGTEITTVLAPTDATVTYQWFVGETPIEGAESSSFVVTEAYIGQTITCVATGTGNFYGTVSASTAAIPVPVAQLDVPANFGVSVYNADVTASWSAVENASSYTLEYKPVDGDFWTSMLEIQGTTATFVGASGTVYNVRVRANGTGDFADSDYAATITDKATGPVVAINANKVTVSWVDESPEADAVRYRVAGTEKWTLKKLKAGVTSLTFNAAIGTNYDVEVLLDQQETNVLRGTAVVLDQAKLAAVKPSIADDSFQINVTNYAAKNLAANVKQAILTINGTMTTLDIVNQQGSAVLPGGGNVTFENGQFTFTGMASNSQYKVLVSFSDGHSVSKVSGAVSVKTLKAPYLAPVLTSATATSDTSIVVAWEPSVGKNTDTPAQKYTVQYSLDGVKWSNATTGATGNSFTIQKLKGGNEYQVRVLATKDSAFEASAPSAVMTAETLALPVIALEKTSVKDDSFQVNVTNFQTTNLTKAAAVNVTTDKFGTAQIALQDGAGSAIFDGGMTVAFENGALTFKNAPSNTQMKVQVSFAIEACTTALSKALAVKTIMASYNKPVLISAIATSATTVEVAWETVYGKNSTTAAQKYTIQYSTDGAKWTNATTSATGTSFTIQNLKPKTKYLIAVIATKDQWFNASEPSDSLLVTTLG